MIRKIQLGISIDNEKNVIGVIDNLSELGLVEGVDRTLFLMGVYNYLLNRESSKFQRKVEVRR